MSLHNRNAPRNGRTAICHKDGTVTLWDGFFWTKTDATVMAPWIRKAIAELDEKTRKRVCKHLKLES